MMEVDEENVNECDATNANQNDVSYDTNRAIVGYKLQKFFPFYGWFDVEVFIIIPNVDKSVHVRCDDGDFEDVTRDKLDTIDYEGSILIGEIVFKFIKKNGREHFYGVVVRILSPNRSQQLGTIVPLGAKFRK